MRIAIQSKEALLADTLTTLLQVDPSISVVARECQARDVVEAAKRHSADIVIVDTAHISEADLQFLIGVRASGRFAILVIATDDDEALDPDVYDARVSRRAGAAELLEQLRALAAVRPMSVREYKRGYRMGSRLSRREYEIAEFVSKGLSNRSIASISGLREQSVKNLVSVVMRKLKCDNRTQVALKLLNNEIPIPEE